MIGPTHSHSYGHSSYKVSEPKKLPNPYLEMSAKTVISGIVLLTFRYRLQTTGISMELRGTMIKTKLFYVLKVLKIIETG